MLRRLLKVSFIIAWIALAALLIQRDLLVRRVDSREVNLLQEARESNWYGIWFKNKRIGYVKEHLQPDGNDFILTQQAQMTINILQEKQPISMDLHARLDSHSTLREFHFSFASPFYKTSAQGIVEDNTVRYELDTGQTIIKDSLQLARPPILPVNQRGYLLGKLTEPGSKVKIPQFDPLSLSGREAVIEYRGREKLMIHSRIYNLHRFSNDFGGMKIDFWLNDAGKVIKEESPAGFVFLAEPEFKAKQIAQNQNELLAAAAAPYSGELPDSSATSITYRLTMPSGLDLQLEGGRQQFHNGLLTINKEKMPAHASLESCSNEEFLEPSPYVQSGHTDIIQQAAAIRGGQQDPAVIVRSLADWVHTRLEKRPVLGLPDALSTLRSGKGDCNEHAALFAALARASGVPTAIVAGVTLHKGAFYYHAWNEVCLDGKWISLDTTVDQIPADLFHIRFGRGDMTEQLAIGGLIGKLHVEIVSSSRGKEDANP